MIKFNMSPIANVTTPPMARRPEIKEPQKKVHESKYPPGMSQWQKRSYRKKLRATRARGCENRPGNTLPRIDFNQFVQHDVDVLRSVKRRIFDLARTHHLSGYSQFDECDPDQVHPGSVVGRILSDCDGPIPKAWNRFCRIDFQNGREYDQPYRVNHPEEAVDALIAIHELTKEARSELLVCPKCDGYCSVSGVCEACGYDLRIKGKI